MSAEEIERSIIKKYRKEIWCPFVKSVKQYALLSEGFYTEQAYATAVVLLVMVVGINTLSAMVAKRVSVR